MQTSEATIEYLEAHIPELAEAVFKQAYWQALAAGSSVLSVDNGKIIEVFPDGTRKTIKQIDQLIPLTPRRKQAS